jgi:hypothetical protein
MNAARRKSNQSGRGIQDATSVLQSSGLIELNETEQLSVADHRKSQPQQYQDRE